MRTTVPHRIERQLCVDRDRLASVSVASSDRGAIDPVDLHERITAVRTPPFRLLAEVERRAGCPIKGLFVLTVRTVVVEFEAHTADLARE